MVSTGVAASRSDGLARLVAFEHAADRRAAAAHPVARTAAAPTSARWAAFRALVGQLVAELLADIIPAIDGGDGPVHDQLGRGHVLDRQPDRLEDGDGPLVAPVRPFAVDRPDLDQLVLGD
jgi:hypothetical protein